MSGLLRPALVSFTALTLLTGVGYPLAVGLVGRLVFPSQSAGSPVVVNGVVVGSRLIGQSFTAPGDFQGRPSATAAFPYDPSYSSGSNLGPTNAAWNDSLRARARALRAANPANPAPVPVELATASASGLDPHLSPAAAAWQVSRVARARGLDFTAVRALVDAHVEPRTFGLLGEPRVNVLQLDLALDSLAAARGRR